MHKIQGQNDFLSLHPNRKITYSFQQMHW